MFPYNFKRIRCFFSRCSSSSSSPKQRRCRYLLCAAILFCALFLLGKALWCVSFLYTPLITAKQDQAAVDFIFPQGAAVKVLAADLQRRGVLSHPKWFVWWAKIQRKATVLQAGEYRITPGVTTPIMLLNMMVKGEAIRHGLTIVEGWTFAQVKAALAANPYLLHELQGLSDASIMQRIGHAGEMPEGRFAPETYVFSGKISDTAVLHNAYKKMQKQLDAAWQAATAAHAPQQDDGAQAAAATTATAAAATTVTATTASATVQKNPMPAFPSSPYETLIIASLVERESAYSKERPLIAGVIMRRLQLGMPLQIDAAVIYGLGKDYKGKLCESDLQRDTPYNTYTRRGLPPTPIAAPSKDAIEAALHPVIGEEIYYVAKGDGTHIFTKTFAEHVQARKKYLKSN